MEAEMFEQNLPPCLASDLEAWKKGVGEKFGVMCIADNGIAYDFSKRGLPPFKVRIVEGLKALVFAVVPNNWIVRVQDAFGLGAKEMLKAQ